MRTLLSTFILLALVGVLLADGLNMYKAHNNAVDTAVQAAEEAAQTYLETYGDQDAAHRAVQDMAVDNRVELVALRYHKGTTRWYEVTVEAQPTTVLFGHLPYFKDHIGQAATTVEHF